MKVWILKDSEPLPIFNADQKKMRSQRLADYLVERGHDVVWWSSTFSHLHKKKHCEGHQDVQVSPNFKLKLIEAGGYKKNISFSRFYHHYKVGRGFEGMALEEKAPDIIIASMPIMEFPIKAMKYAKERNIPVIIDIRDQWPDIFPNYFPKVVSHFVKTALSPYNSRISKCFREADGLVSMSQDLLHWALQKAKIDKGDLQKVFYLGYDESCLADRADIPKLNKLPKDKVIFGYLGALVKSYEVDLIVHAAQIIENKSKYNCHFIIAGDGDMRSLLEEKAKNLQNVSILGWLNKSQSAAFMEKVDVSLVPNKTTAIPNKVFEALFFGNPIIFSMNGEARTLLEKHQAGLHYELGNVDSFLSAVEVFLEKEKLQQMKDNARSLYDNYLQSNMIYNGYCDFIEEVFKKSKKKK